MTGGHVPPPLPPKHQVHILAQVDIYLDNFMLTFQGVPKERNQMLLHLFQSINAVFRPNEVTYFLRKEPISARKISQGGDAWSTKKTVLGWELDTKWHHLRIAPKRDKKVRTTLDAIPATAHHFQPVMSVNEYLCLKLVRATNNNRLVHLFLSYMLSPSFTYYQYSL